MALTMNSWPLVAIGWIFPIMSTPHVKNGQGDIMVCSGIVGMCFKSPWTWHWWHLQTWAAQSTSIVGILMRTGLGMLMIEKVHWGVAFMWVIILSPGWVRSRILSPYQLLRLNTSLPIVVAPNFYGCKNSLIMVFVKNILPFIATIPVPLTSLKIIFKILEQNI